MNERKELGRIKEARFGFGGYDDAMFGLTLVFSGQAWGTQTFVGQWATRSERAQYSEAEHMTGLLDGLTRLRETLTAAKKRDVSQLVGVPIEATFEGNLLKSWRVLEEVL